MNMNYFISILFRRDLFRSKYLDYRLGVVLLVLGGHSSKGK